MANNSKKILLATGIFPPDIGGPSTYVFSLAKELLLKEHKVKIAAYGDEKFSIFNFSAQGGSALGGQFSLQSGGQANNFQLQNNQFLIHKISRKNNIFLRYFKYFFRVFKLAKGADIVYAFDLSSSGLPALLAAKLRRRPVVVRLGGDFLWEKAFAKGWTDKPIMAYYESKKSFKEKLYFILNKFVIKRFTKIVFSTDWQKEIYLKYYKVKNEETAVIINPYPSVGEIESPKEINNRNIIFAGRLIKLKNLERTIKAISSIKGVNFRIYGEGPERENLEILISDLNLGNRVKLNNKLSHADFLKLLTESYAAIVPSVSEISPNTVLECIKLGKPVLVTRECGFYSKLKDNLIFIDPLDTADIRKKIELLLNKDIYSEYVNGIKEINSLRSISDLAKEHLELFKPLIKEKKIKK